MEVNLIVATAKNGVIGKENDIPWYIPKDLKYFKEATKNSIVIMGRKNWESIPEKFRPLKDRINIVLTRNENYQAKGAVVLNSIDKAFEYAVKKSLDKSLNKIFIIGGSEIYKQFMPFVTKLYITEIKKDFDGDVYFPEWDRNKFIETSRVKNEKSKHNEDFTYDFVVYEKRK